MALYDVVLRLATDQPGIPARRWSNRFILDSDSAFSAAAAIRAQWIGKLRNGVRERVYAYEVYATDTNTTTDNFTTLPILPGDQRGTLANPVGGLEPYLPKACMAVTLNVASSRPSRKFWRPGFLEADITNGVSVNPDLVELTTNLFEGVIQDLFGAWVDPDSQEIASVGRIRLTTREFGREATADVPAPPPLG